MFETSHGKEGAPSHFRAPAVAHACRKKDLELCPAWLAPSSLAALLRGNLACCKCHCSKPVSYLGLKLIYCATLTQPRRESMFNFHISPCSISVSFHVRFSSSLNCLKDSWAAPKALLLVCMYICRLHKCGLPFCAGLQHP